MNFLLLILVSVGIIFAAAKFVTAEVDKLSSKIHSTRFGLSLVLLGFLTSLTEISVAIDSQINRHPEIYAGNLIGGSLVILLLIIPILALLNNGLRLNERLSPFKVTAFIMLLSTPALLALDGIVQLGDSLIMIAAYISFLVVEMSSKRHTKHVHHNLNPNIASGVAKITLAGVIIYAACHFLVIGVEELSAMVGVPYFIVSVLFLSLATNVPEMSLAISSVRRKTADVALGDYVGSAAINVLILGTFSLINGPYVIELNGFKSILVLILICNAIFLWFGLSQRKISRWSAIGLMLAYAAITIYQISIIGADI